LAEPRGAFALDRDGVRPFAWTMLAAAAVASFVAHRRGAPTAAMGGALGVGLLLVVLAYTLPSAVRPLERAWTAIGRALGAITTPVLLVVVFALVLVPTGVVLALLGKDPLERRRDPSRASYWIERRRPRFGRDGFERLS
jgi:hypothetical protein